MAELRDTSFYGMRPALYNTLRPNGVTAYADVAVNAYLRDGSITPMRGNRVVQTVPFVPKSITKLPAYTCCAGLYALPYCASVVEAPMRDCCVCGDHVIAFSAECCDHEHLRCDPCTQQCWPLVVPTPTIPPTLVSMTESAMRYCGNSVATECSPLGCGETGSPADDAGCNVLHGKGAEDTAYVYTWVDAFGVESPPSPPSSYLIKWDDQVVTIDVPVFYPANVVTQRIYRAVRDYPVGNDPSVGSASYQLIGERPFPTVGAFVDDMRLCDIPGGTLQTMDVCPPPKCFDQVILLDSGYYVGFDCNEVMFSERHEPWNWPQKYRIRLADKIVGIAGLGDVLFVGTTGMPYRIKLSSKYGGLNDGLPNQERIQSFDTAFDIEQFPDCYPCVSRDAMVGTSFGAMYASTLGLVALKVDSGVAQIVSGNRIGSAQWAKWVPNMAVWHDGFYIGLRGNTGKGFVFEVPSDGRQMIMGDFVEVDFGVSRLHSGRDGRLYGVDGQDIVEVFGANRTRTYRYKSRVFRAASYTQMCAAKVVGVYGEPVRFRLYADGDLVYEKMVRNSRPFRMPKVKRATDFRYEVFGTTVVSEIHIGPNFRALATNATSAGSGQGTGTGE